MKRLWQSLSISSKLSIPIQVMLFLALITAHYWIMAIIKNNILDAAKIRATISADGIINGMNMLMITNKISEPDTRRLFIDKMGASEHIKELRIIRAQQVQDQFGLGLPEEQPKDATDLRAMTSKQTQFQLNEDGLKPTLRAVMPFIVSKNFRGTNCLSCHQVADGSVNGAASITIDMTEDFAVLKHTGKLLIAGHIILQILLFFSISWLIRKFLNPVGKLQAAMQAMEVSCSMEQFVPIEVPSGGNDEIGKLTASFNQMSTALCESERSMRLAESIYLSNADAIIVTDENNHIVDVNPAFTRITGHAREDVLGRDPKFMQSGRHDKAFYQEMWQSLLTTDCWQGEIWDRHKDGSAYVKSIHILVLRHKDGRIHRHIAQFSDITEQKEKDSLIKWQANYDPLTNLPNRRLFNDRLGQAIKMSHRTNFPLALLYIDLDHFKVINDTLGHAHGDNLLIEAAERISACVREADTVSRLGGDEFTVILPEIGDIGQAKRIAQKIVDTMMAPFFFGDDETGHCISSSIGIAIYPEDATTMEGLLRCADKAMYAAKSAGRNRYARFEKINNG